MVEVAGDARSVVFGGLAIGTAHTFTVTAVNKAGNSDPSAPVSAMVNPTPPQATTPRGSGYWMVSARGSVHAFGEARWLGDAPIGTAAAVDLEPSASRAGYWVVDSAGHVFAFGDIVFRGSLGASPPPAPIRAVAAV